ncbi:hypothetical protein EDD29_7405 [Actinocorallia herbida]|uniref:Polysaccharide deacetylase n=1 Tax=Actinocorallia herbida TaxID=58109 RepID=A0A3N1D843_9ACTN|nr:hypothetical protein [Actinocorallia herbida]ROO89700.1 hypothetical protein EDD29_7405 [Actinocorallia herbida]
MRRWTKWTAWGLGGALLAGCGISDPADTPGRPARGATPVATGDGSSVDGGPQPQGWTPERLKAGEAPPQFVVLSWDGAGATDGTFARVRQAARLNGATMTFFLSGLYLLPERRRHLYRPPHRAAGASDLGVLTDRQIRDTVLNLGLAWREGDEIGTQFNGHYCGRSGVRTWTAADWKREIRQAVGFVGSWKTHTGFTDLPPLPFDYGTELVGGRTPCLGGGRTLRKAARQLGWKYDASGTGRQVWPRRNRGLWRLPVQTLPFPGRAAEVRGTDHDILRAQIPHGFYGSAHRRPHWRKEARAVLQAGFERAYRGNRAPLVLGNHFAHWNGGIHLEAVHELLTRNARRPDVRFVSFKQLVAWLELQDPAVLAALRALPVGKAPAKGWADYLSPAARPGPAHPDLPRTEPRKTG